MRNNNSGFSTSASSSRVSSIPNSVRKTIQNIKEITNNHSEDDIYAMLKDCSMDPNETTQRLLHLDTFHEVKSKRDKRKEMVKNRSGEESKWKPGHQGQGMRGARGSSSSQYKSADAGIRRNNFARKSAVEDSRERGFRNPPAEKSMSFSVNGHVKVPNGSIFGGPDAKPSPVGDGYSKDAIVSGADSFSTVRANASAEYAHSPSEPFLKTLCESKSPFVVGPIKRDVRIQQTSSEAVTHIPADSKTESLSNLNQSDAKDLNGSNGFLLTVEKEASDTANAAHSIDLQECRQAENCCGLNGASIVKPYSPQGVEEVALKTEKLKFSQRQHVIIPDHIQVPDAVKNVLSFGSIDAIFRAREKNLRSESVENLHPSGDSAVDEATTKLSSCDNNGVATASQVEHADHPECQSHLADVPSAVDTKVSSASVSKDDKPQADTFSAMGPPFPYVGTAPIYSFGFMPPMLGNTLVQPEGFVSHAHSSSSLSGNVPVVSTPSSTPPPTQSAGAGQSSIESPQLIPFFRQPYPPNFIPYTHYYSPFYAPPTMHQYYGQAGFPAPVPTGNVFLPPPSAATGMNVSSTHYKPGANTGNQAPSGIPSGYGSYSSSQLGYGPNAVATCGNASKSEDLVPNGLKDYTLYPEQQSDGTAVWPPAAGRDTASLPMNPFLNLPPRGQHVIGPQSSHGAFAVYHTLQPMGTPTPVLPLLQQSQSVVGPTDAVGAPPNAHQQSQRQPQSNWHS